MSGKKLIRVGCIGAGNIFRGRHLPGLLNIPGVQVVAVANRTIESSSKIAAEFHIPEPMADWRKLIDRKDIDTVFIGTWPNMHCEMSIAALLAGKHVFCQARMAMDVGQAHDMLRVARAFPGKVSMICPPPTRMPYEPFIQETLRNGTLGQIISVELLHASAANTKTNTVHWREKRECSGNQIMAMGIYAETLNAWVGLYETLIAQTATFIREKTDTDGRVVEINVPQAVTITGRLVSGALCIEHHLGLAVDTTTLTDRLTIWGTRGTLRYEFGKTIEIGLAGQSLTPVDVPDSYCRTWWAESEFITAVRLADEGRPFKVTPDFQEGLAYMQKVEAVYLSSGTGRAVRPSEL